MRATSSGRPETWSACTWVSSTATIARALGLGEGDVLVDEIDVRVDDGERRLALAAEQVGGARGLVVQQLAEVHVGLRSFELIGLTSYQVIY